MNKLEAKFIFGAATIGHLKNFNNTFDSRLPQVAFIGKSNVGKSSLINLLLNRKSLAHTSNTPGRTQQINFFNIGDSLIFADLPGYGYAKVPPKIHEKWEELILYYLETKNNLEVVCVLVDSRRGIKPHDAQILDLLDQCGLIDKTILIYTKADKATKAEQEKLVIEQVRVPIERILFSSNVNKASAPAIRNKIFNMIVRK